MSATGIKHHKDHRRQTQALWENTIPSVPALSPDVESDLVLTECQGVISGVNGGGTPFLQGLSAVPASAAAQ